MEDLLRQFYTDVNTREVVKSYMNSLLDELAVEAVFNGKDVTGFPHAKDLVDKMFSELKNRYSPKEKPVMESSR